MKKKNNVMMIAVIAITLLMIGCVWSFFLLVGP